MVIAPRLTPPSVTGIKANTTGAGLFSRLSSSFGYLNKQVRIRLRMLDFGNFADLGVFGQLLRLPHQAGAQQAEGCPRIQAFEGRGLLGQRHRGGPLLPPVQLLWLPG